MSRKLEHLLREWGAWHIRNMDFADEYGENILYRCGILWGRIQGGKAGHRILCPEQPRHLRQVDIALRRLPEHLQICVKTWYCAPLKEDGEPYTMKQVADLSSFKIKEFKNYLEQGRVFLSGQLYK